MSFWDFFKGLFGQPSNGEVKLTMQKLAAISRVFATLDSGICSGVIIQIPIPAADFAGIAKHKDFLSAFMTQIELRIKKGEVVDPRDGLIPEEFMKPLNLSVPRLVVSLDNRQLFSWQAPE